VSRPTSWQRLGAVELLPEQHNFFRARGFLRLEQAVAAAHLKSLQTHVASNLSRHGINPSGRGIPRSISELPVFQQIGKLSQLIKAPDAALSVVPPPLARKIATLAAARVTTTQTQFLVSPPKQGDWSLDKLNWHTDLSSTPGKTPGIQAFLIVQDLDSRGGATLALAGSHLHMGNDVTSARVRDALRKGHAGEDTLGELNLSVVEFCGRAGDVYVMDMRLLHTPSVNTSQRLRVVATVRLFFG
jgi:Phytanoyl-CoA dioxygenase (PhyH)